MKKTNLGFNLYEKADNFKVLSGGLNDNFKKVDELLTVHEVEGILFGGDTSITLYHDKITEDSTFDIYTSVFGVSPKVVTVEVGSITITFKAQTNDIDVKVVIR